jgi:hypothetical protein
MITQMINLPTSIRTILSLQTQAYSKNDLPMYSTPSTAQETENIIHLLKGNDSGGYEELSMWILKLSSSFISSPMNLCV